MNNSSRPTPSLWTDSRKQRCFANRPSGRSNTCLNFQGTLFAECRKWAKKATKKRQEEEEENVEGLKMVRLLKMRNDPNADINFGSSLSKEVIGKRKGRKSLRNLGG
ncbi:hypothetical protein V9T40_006422 [Parthenolecanium corni]|uniref:Uncharacterized protein n=1 Tax=Parthenolecanium corni TaxID=536013 RepID=A0AAN9TPG5_9HEMI